MHFPDKLKEDQKIVFSIFKQPSWDKTIRDYENQKFNPKPISSSTIALPLPANLEDSLNHTWNAQHGLSLTGSAARAAQDYVPDATGLHADPNYFYSYVETQPRQFSYTLNAIPKNQNEALNIQNIIYFFKKYSSPDSSAGILSNYFWKMELSNKILNKSMALHKKYWALTTVSTNYTGSGSALFFKDGQPKNTIITLTFQEINVMYSKDW